MTFCRGPGTSLIRREVRYAKAPRIKTTSQAIVTWSGTKRPGSPGMKLGIMKSAGCSMTSTIATSDGDLGCYQGPPSYFSRPLSEACANSKNGPG